MIKLIPIKVECHFGYKADEYPRRFIRDEHAFEVLEVTDRWYQGDQDSEIPASNYFKVLVTDGSNFILKHVLGNDSWFLCEKV